MSDEGTAVTVKLEDGGEAILWLGLGQLRAKARTEAQGRGDQSESGREACCLDPGNLSSEFLLLVFSPGKPHKHLKFPHLRLNS